MYLEGFMQGMIMEAKIGKRAEVICTSKKKQPADHPEKVSRKKYGFHRKRCSKYQQNKSHTVHRASAALSPGA